jgi:hypothetical protein
MRSPPGGYCTLLAQYSDYPLGYGTGIVLLNQVAGKAVLLSTTLIGIKSLYLWVMEGDIFVTKAVFSIA